MNFGQNWKTGSSELNKQRNKGLCIGFLFPMLIMPIILFVFYLDSKRRFAVEYSYYVKKIFSELHHFCNVLSLSVLCNLPVFFILLRRKNDWGARGVLAATMCYVVLVFVLKIIEGGL